MKNTTKILIVFMIGVIGIDVLNVPPSSFAAPATQQVVMRPGEMVQLRLDDKVNPVRISAPAFLSIKRSPAATVTVNYLPAGSGLWGDTCLAWPASAQSAFSYATNLWALLLVSPVPITVDACYSNNLLPGVLGHGGAQGLWANFPNAPQANTFYSIAMVNKYNGSDYDLSRNDIYIALTNAVTWYTGTDGATPAGQIDLVSVVMHEMAHGLGFTGSMRIDDGAGSSECNGTSGYGCWGYTGYFGNYPIVYDRFTQDSAGSSLIGYSTPSTALATALKTNPLYFNGTNANAANGGTRVKLYAPTTWSAGSSYVHLDYNTFANTPNRLMVYMMSSGASIHDPGPVTIGIMQDLGWQFALTCYSLSTSVAPAGSGLFIANPLPNCVNGTQYVSGTSVTLSAISNPGFAFNIWSGSIIGNANPNTFVVNSAMTVTANYISVPIVYSYRFLPFILK